MPVELVEIEPAELSRVVRAATGREALTLKDEDESMTDELEALKNLGELLEIEADAEDDVSDLLKDADAKARNAAVGATRLIHHFRDELDEETRKSLASRIFEVEAEDDDEPADKDEKVEKALDELPEDVRKAIEAEREEAQSALEELRKERERRERAQLLEKARSEFDEVHGSPEDIADLLFTAKRSLDEERYDQLVETLKAMNEQINESESLLKSYGAPGTAEPSGGAYQELQKRAEKRVEEGRAESKQKAVRAIRREDPKLADRVRREQTGS